MVRLLLIMYILFLFFNCHETCQENKSSPFLQYDTSSYVPQTYGKPPVFFQKPLSPETSLLHMQVPEGFRIEIFASEPDVVNPIAINWDHHGRLWVVESLDYPHGEEGSFSRIKILEDINHDGKADEIKIFADSLQMVTGLIPINNGVLIAQVPHLLFLKDTNNDDRVDEKKVIISGWGTYDSHAGPSNLKYGFDNKIWGAVGYAGFNSTETYNSTDFSQGIFHLNPDGSELKFHSQFSNNTWGLGFSESFDVFGSTANNMHAVFVGIPHYLYRYSKEIHYHGANNISGHFEVHSLVKNLRQVDNQGGFTAAAGFSFYTARSFPKEYWNKIAFVCEPTAGVVHNAIIKQDNPSYKEEDGGNILASPDEWFSPIHAEVGPDGALWVADWYNFVVQHNPVPKGFKKGSGNAYINPLRDKRHGRIYRIIYDKSTPHIFPKLDKNRPNTLLETLKHPNLFWRLTAQRMIVERNRTDIVSNLIEIVSSEDKDDWIAAIHALWSIHGLGIIEEDSLKFSNILYNLFSHPNRDIRKNTLKIAPSNINTTRAIIHSNILQDEDLNIRLNAIIKSCSIPSNDTLIQALIKISQDPVNYSDPLLAEALYIALSNHKNKVLKHLIKQLKTYPIKKQLLKGVKAGWNLSEFNTDKWQSIKTGLPFEKQIPELVSFNGSIWYRSELKLPELPKNEVCSLRLGPIDNSDITWVNGVEVGRTTDRWEEVRQYKIPKGVLKKGINIIAVRVEDLRDLGGIMGKENEIYVLINKKKFYISNAWKYAVESNLKENLTFSSTNGLLAFFIENNSLYQNNDIDEKIVQDETIEVLLQPMKSRLRFNQDTINIPAGKNIQIKFTNSDNMPHNLVIGKPGSLEIIGKTSERLVGKSNFIPNIDEVLFSLKSIAPKENAILSFIAPKEKGDYIFVCTYPGHWRTMNGILSIK